MADGRGRGVYRGIYCNLLDDEDFQALPPRERHVLLTARLSREAGPAAIWRCYREVLARQCGYPVQEVEEALEHLARAGWIELDGAIVWIVNGLRYDPTLRMSCTNHSTAVRRVIEALPRFQIVVNFCRYYNLEDPSKGIGRPFEGYPKTPDRSSPSESRIPNPELPPSPLKGGTQSLSQHHGQHPNCRKCGTSPRGTPPVPNYHRRWVPYAERPAPSSGAGEGDAPTPNPATPPAEKPSAARSRPDPPDAEVSAAGLAQFAAAIRRPPNPAGDAADQAERVRAWAAAFRDGQADPLAPAGADWPDEPARLAPGWPEDPWRA